MNATPHEAEAVMSGHGYYNRHSIMQASAAELGIAALAAAAGSVPVPDPPRPLLVADYGASQGQNSLRPMGAAIAALRARTPDAITVVHTDLPGNDFAALFETVANDPSSYVRTDPAAYALAAGRSFYGEVLPPGSVALGWSAVTTHWLSTVPCPVPGHLSPHSSDDPAVKARFAAQARADWESFLAARAAELEPGGRLVMVEPCAHPDGHVGSEGLMGVMDEALGQLVDEGKLATDALAAVTLPVWMRTPAEYGDPIGEQPGLEAVSVQVIEDWESPLWTRFEQDGDAAAYAREAVAGARAWSEAMLTAAIPDPAVMDDLYDRCRRLGEADPERLHLHVFQVVLDIARR